MAEESWIDETRDVRVRETAAEDGYPLDCPWCGRENDLYGYRTQGTHQYACDHCEAPLRLTIESVTRYTLRHEEALDA